MKQLHGSDLSTATVCFVSKSSPQHYKNLDFKLLCRSFRVIRHDYAYRVGNVLRFVKTMGHADVIFSWFASPWMALMLPFVPRSTRVVVVAGGYDVANCVELKHGARFHPIKGKLTRWLLTRADVVLPVSDFNCEELLTLVTPRAVRRVYNAMDLPEFSLIPGVPRKKQVITVGIFQKFISKCKGHYRFLELARMMPDYEFVMMGRDVDGTRSVLESLAPENVRFVDYVDRSRMIREMLNSCVYLQLSYYESFGVSVAEAIACGCVPIVTAGTALPEVCGIEGRVVAEDACPHEIKEMICDVFESSLYLEVDTDSVRDRFSVDRRESELVDVIAGVL